MMKSGNNRQKKKTPHGEREGRGSNICRTQAGFLYSFFPSSSKQI